VTAAEAKAMGLVNVIGVPRMLATATLECTLDPPPSAELVTGNGGGAM